MTTLSNNIVQLQLDALSYDAPKDVIRKQWVQFWRCNDIEFRIGCFYGDQILDVSGFKTLYLSLRTLDNGCPPSGGAAVLLLGSTDKFDSSVTLADWEAGTKQHAVITFSAEENALAAGEYWMSIWAETSEGKVITLGAGVCKIHENGGISTTPPDPIDIYYTATECDARLTNYYTKAENDENLNAYYTKDESDTKLTDYYTKVENDEKLNSYYTKTECDSRLTDYYTKTENDENLNSYYTKTESDSRFAKKGQSGGSGISPTNKGTMIIGDGIEAQILPAGEKSQVLIADPDSEYGAAWGDYPWRYITHYNVTESVEEISFEHIFNASRCKHYKILFNFIDLSVVSSRLLMQYGYDQDDEVYWESNTQEYNFSVTDFAGTIAHYEAYRWTTGYFAFGSESTSYRNNGGNLYGEIDIWNDGDIEHWIQARAQTTSFRIYNENTFCVNGIYSFLFKNVGKHVINSVKFMLESGNFNGGRFSVYGIR